MALSIPSRPEVVAVPAGATTAVPYVATPEEAAAAKASCFAKQVEANPSTYTPEMKTQLKAAIGDGIKALDTQLDSLTTRNTQLNEQIFILSKRESKISANEAKVADLINLTKQAAQTCPSVSAATQGVLAATGNDAAAKRELRYRIGLAQTQKNNVRRATLAAQTAKDTLFQMGLVLT